MRESKNGTIITNFEVKFLKQATAYYVQLEAIDAKGRPGPPVPGPENPLQFITNPAPVMFVTIDETYASDDYLTVNWRSAVGQVDYYELQVFNAASNIQNLNDRILHEVVMHKQPSSFNTSTQSYQHRVNLAAKKAQFLPDTDYRIVIYSVLLRDDVQLKSAPTSYLWSLPREYFSIYVITFPQILHQYDLYFRY